ncbi:MAG: hypothetical protein PF904_21490 [Kiritimatiellae bacterium]|jgi:hypothetical protein|nr:hypothetical protein [Kiritimatiellia bacterium]
MKYSENNVDFDKITLEKDAEELAPLFDDIVINSKLGPPPPVMIEKIVAEASRYTLRRNFVYKMRRVFSSVAAAAALFLIIAGGIEINSIQQSNRRMVLMNQLCIVSNESLENGQVQETSTDTLADLLMEMQGFDEDTYFAVIVN